MRSRDRVIAAVPAFLPVMFRSASERNRPGYAWFTIPYANPLLSTSAKAAENRIAHAIKH